MNKNALSQGKFKIRQTLPETRNKYHPSVFITQIISRRQKNADAKVVLSISRRQKWNSRRQFSKNYFFPNIQLKVVVNKLAPIKNLSDYISKFLMGADLAH